MKTRFVQTALAILLLASAGCSNLPSVVRSLAKDPATVTIHFSGYGTQFDFYRSGRTNTVQPTP